MYPNKARGGETVDGRLDKPGRVNREDSENGDDGQQRGDMI